MEEAFIYSLKQADMPQIRHIGIEYEHENHNDEILDGSSYSMPQTVPSDTKVLLHSCCAPCSGAMVEYMISRGNIKTF